MRARKAAAANGLAIALGLAATFHAAELSALTFDAQGRAKFEAGAVLSESFEGAVDPSNPSPFGLTCLEGCSYELFDEAYAQKELALHGRQYVRTSTPDAPFEVELALPEKDAAYRFHVWVRHARARARILFEHATREDDSAHMFPSGRVTSDGWIELVTNSVSVSGSELDRARLRIEGTAVDLDGFEVVAAGSYSASTACLGAFDPVCGDQAVCIAERCRAGDRYVPPLPRPEHRKSIADYLMGRVRNLFGGRLSRTRYMPAALVEMRKMETAETAWDYWSAFSRGVRKLNDWHTSLSFPMPSSSSRALGVCFIEGHADLSQTIWPSAPQRADILVSHVGVQNTLGLKPGDRLVAVDGQHPLDWARSLLDANPSHHAATDPDVDAEFAESMRSLIPRFARQFSVVRCNAQPLSCSEVIETIQISDIPEGSGFGGPNCDNRPAYHLLNPPSDSLVATHFFFEPWRDLLVDSRPGEAIYGMTWDTLFGRGRLSSGVRLTDYFLATNEFFKQNARGVILDHRAGNGGTIDAPQAITQLVRAPFELSVGPGFMAVAAYDGPDTLAEGKVIFDRFRSYPNLLYEVGSSGADTSLPVALLIHRDGSASDWLPHGMKGAPKVRIFGPHETAGAFSSFYQYSYWSRFDFQLASGDTITHQGEPLIGHGVEPDEIVEHTQSALLQGKDLPYEAALAWVRANLK